MSYGVRYDGFSTSAFEDAGALMVIALILAVAATVLAFIFITPEKKRESLPKFLKVLHDIANFKGLFIEVILKALYIFLTVFVILVGFFSLFLGADFLSSLLVMIIGPIIIRLGFEATMMLILLVKNVISINNKLRSQDDQGDADMGFNFSEFKAAPQQPVYEQPTAPAVVYCPHFGAQVEGAFCPQCGTPMGQ